jgi:hypothetical protein
MPEGSFVLGGCSDEASETGSSDGACLPHLP